MGWNTGIGYEICKAFLVKNATVYMASRSETRAAEAILRLERATGKRCLFLHLDLQDLHQIRHSTSHWLQLGSKLDVLVNNAGIMAPPFQLTKDGIESQFGTNHVGHFLLTRELLPALLKAPCPRIVNVSSYAYEMAPNHTIVFENIQKEEAMSNFERYGVSKLANLLFTAGLHKRFGSKMYVNAVHPGAVDTELVRGPKESLQGTWTGFFVNPLYGLTGLVFLSPASGALSSLYAAAAAEVVESGIKNKFIVPFGKVVETSFPMDEALADELWSYTENLVAEKLAK
ncbi:hypothetical protein HDU91_005939 [Kappamyces sp. JEL0680]|nr:hypothetical protein HDU91_005939 [Kappamyces sp. JEL0680]